MFFEMLQAQDLLMLFVQFCDTGCYLIKRRSMQGINAWIVSLPYADPGFFLFIFFFFWGGGRGAAWKQPWHFFSTQL